MDTATELRTAARAFFTPGKGILAADESTPTMNKRLQRYGITVSPEMRRTYREFLFTSEGIEKYLTGAIMYDASIRNHTHAGVPFVDVLLSKGIAPIIKVDRRTTPHTGFSREVVTEGLDDLPQRLREYRMLGARGAKWRAVFRISDQTPTPQNLACDAVALARYAAACIEAGIVPIIEPEVLHKGDHDITRAATVTRWVLQTVFDYLAWYRVDMHSVILKTSMVLAGSESTLPSPPGEVAEATVATLRAAVPPDVAGVVFLSGGQSPREATENLNAIALRTGELSWPVTFSYARAIQKPVLEAWQHAPEAARAALLHRLQMNALATEGAYNSSLEETAAA